MAAVASHAPPADLDSSLSYAPIPDYSPSSNASTKRHLTILVSSLCFVSLLFLISTHHSLLPSVAELNHIRPTDHTASLSPLTGPPSRGPSQGVSEKVFRPVRGAGRPFSWSNAMLTWQRTAYHFQPEKNWMNDPNGPLYHKGWYHLFYQYNPESAVWGTITWGHAVSRDLIHWFHLPYAMLPDQWYDANGVWTGSATILPDGRIIMIYTGDTTDVVQVQCLAYPANLSDPLLLHWVKYPNNPVMRPPPGVGLKDFRDPTTAWLTPRGDKWRVTIGSKIGKAGVALVYETADFLKFELLDGFMHRVAGTGMWECIDFYPVSLTGKNGLDTSENGSGIKHVMKVSLDDDKNDYYAIGTYDPDGNKWVPDDPDLDVGIGLRYDYGRFYASKTFYDQNKRRRVLFGWIKETDAEELDLLKGWASVQSIPRTVVFDQKTKKNIVQWPVEEVESLRMDNVEYNVKLGPGSLVPTAVGSASQLDIVATFEVDKEALKVASEIGVDYSCLTSGGAANRGVLGPFGIVVLADEALAEFTPIYFYVVKGRNATYQTHFCVDELRSSEAPDAEKAIYGSKVPVLGGEKLTLRSLVDHSIVESFVQGGRTVITSRVYPTKAIDGAARVFLFNNATGATVTASIKMWKMGSADLRPFPLDHQL